MGTIDSPERHTEQNESLETRSQNTNLEKKKNAVKDAYSSDNLQQDNKETAIREAKTILQDPQKLEDFLTKMNNISRENNRESTTLEQIGEKAGFQTRHLTIVEGHTTVEGLLDEVKTDTDFLKQVIQTYADKKDSKYDYICREAISLINLQDEIFFKDVFEKSQEDSTKCAAIKKLEHNQNFLQAIALDENASDIVRNTAVERITNENFLLDIITNYKNEITKAEADVDSDKIYQKYGVLKKAAEKTITKIRLQQKEEKKK